jgi:hypothetical protein
VSDSGSAIVNLVTVKQPIKSYRIDISQHVQVDDVATIVIHLGQSILKVRDRHVGININNNSKYINTNDINNYE